MNINRKSAAKHPVMTDEGSTTIPREGSTDSVMNLEIADMQSYSFNERLSDISCIYLLYSEKNNKGYIGSCLNLHTRVVRHKWYLKNNKHHSRKLQNAYNKYSPNLFKIYILEKGNIPLKEREEYWIKHFNTFENGFNCTDKCYTYNSFKLTEDQKNKAATKCSKKVIQFDMEGNYINSYKSITEAARSVNDQSTNISGCCKGRFGYIKDSIFIYESDYDPKKDYRYKGRKYVFTDTHKQKLSKALKGKPKTQYQIDLLSKRSSISVNKFNLDGKLVNTYEKMKICCADNSINGKKLKK